MSSQLTSPEQSALPSMSERAAVAVGLGQFQRAGQDLSLLMKISPEIRYKIFRYLLSTSYTKRLLGYYDDVSNRRYQLPA